MSVLDQRPSNGLGPANVVGAPDRAKPDSALVDGYDRLMFSSLVEEYFGYSDFCNWGYWLDATRDQREACENLVEMLLAFLPEKRGTVLDAACGKGATTRHLLRYWERDAVTGINISEHQLARARLIAPGCSFLRMDATDLELPDASVDVVICVEAAFHFDTRRIFLEEALRVLRPGGRLVLSDILFRRRAHELGRSAARGNFVADPTEYVRLFEEVGYGDVEVVDATDRCWRSYERNHAAYLVSKRLAGHVGTREFKALMAQRTGRHLAITHYLLASGVKP
jgi:SAM-dependent methyltransferase